MDYQLAVIFTVVIPLVLLIWSAVLKADAITRLLIIYWRIASLLLVTVYLMIPAWSIAFITGFAARILIPVGLWFWVDINEEIHDRVASPFKLIVTAWRWAVTVYCAIATLVTIPFLSCAFSQQALQSDFCRVWLEPPFFYKQLFHSGSSPGFLGFLGAIGLTIYLVYFIVFLFRIGRRGRSAMEQ
ncbi:MAG: DUF3177 family protein [Kamptonema sp. SIO4C4]|nr:DUF3177 family protein [Kamptonema sp. SIO4C4]